MNTILQKRIEEAADAYSQGKPYSYEQGFLQGCEWLLKNQWISVEEALPKDFEKVFFRAVGKNDTICFGIGYVAIEYWYTDIQRDEQDYFNFEITHWMLIPELPKGGLE